MTPTSPLAGIQAWLQGHIPAEAREDFYRLAAGTLTFLTGFGLVDNNEGALWGQLVVATITALFALLYSTSNLRVVLYTLVGPLGAVLMAYGLISDVHWAVVLAAIGQVFGVATAASKAVEMVPSATFSAALLSAPAPKVALAVASPSEARAVRRSRAAGSKAGR